MITCGAAFQGRDLVPTHATSREEMRHIESNVARPFQGRVIVRRVRNR
jgi:hypothetical protein